MKAFLAVYRGPCCRCGREIEEGDLAVRINDIEFAHENCDVDAPRAQAQKQKEVGAQAQKEGK